MASSENNSDEGGSHLFTNFHNPNETSSEYNPILQLEYLKEKYREVMGQLKNVSTDKQRLELDVQLLKRELENNKSGILNTYHEYNTLKQKYDNLRSRYDELINDPSRCIKIVEELTKERNKLNELLKESEFEVKTVLSERGTVLKENQKLYDKNESLKRDVDASQRCRDDALKECGVLREKLELMKSRNEFNKELSESQSTQNLETAQQEIERLKKALDKAKGEISKAVQETEIAKGRRDWAISEREKIVHERDSVRNLCDEIRKERDTATSKLLAAIRDKDEAFKEIEQLNERLEVQANVAASAAAVKNPRWSYTQTYDFEGVQQYDTEIIEVDMTPQQMMGNNDLGLILEGGDEDPESNGNSTGTYVVGIENDSIFAGKLKENDYICKINSKDCTNFSKRMILKAIRGSFPQCVITVKRQKMSARRLCSVQLSLTGNRNHGLTFDCGLYISRIDPNSAAGKDGKLSVGDRILSINNKKLESIKNVNDVYSYLNEIRSNVLNIVAIKDCTSAIEASSTSTNQQQMRRANSRQYNKMINSCTQTENSNNNNNNSSNNNASINTSNNIIGNSNGNNLSNNNAMSNSTSSSSNGGNNMRMGLELENNSNNHFLPVTSMVPYNVASAVNNNMMTSSTSSSKSASKLTGMFQKLKDKMHISNHKDSQEHDALAALDSVLDSSDQESTSTKTSAPTKESVSRRSKKKSKDMAQEKNVGTWPRVNMNSVTHENHHTGTIVHHRKKERPRLYLINTDDNEDSHNPPLPTSVTNYFIPPPPPTTAPPPLLSKSSNRNSNPIPSSEYARTGLLSTYGDIVLPTDPKMNQLSGGSATPNSGGGKSIYSRSSTYDHRHQQNTSNSQHIQINRLSLNLSALNKMNYQQQQNSLDFIPIKSHNSIDSPSPVTSKMIATSKSPASLNYSVKSPSAKDTMDFYMPKVSKTLTKYASDNESIEPESASLNSMNTVATTNTLPSHLRKQSMGEGGAGGNRMSHSHFVGGYSGVLHNPNSHPIHHPHPHHAQPPYPNRHPSSPSTVLAGDMPVDSHLPQPASHHHSHGSSIDYPYNNRHSRIQTSSKEEVVSGYVGYEGGTFPRKKENQRFRIPSNQSVTSKGSGIKISSGSIDYCSGSEQRASPMPTFQVQILKQGRVSSANKRNSLPEYGERSKPNIGELRYVHIDKSEMPLGIKIRCRNNGGGVFVSNVGENSIARQVGLHIGDQLLEVCGINMRSATYDLAASVLRQCGNSITMLVQYNPDKYDDLSTSDDNLSRSDSPTPQNSPHLTRSIVSTESIQMQQQQQQAQQSSTQTISKRSSGLSSQMTNKSSKEFSDSLENDSSNQSSPNSVYKEQPRVLFLETTKCANLGISLLGGNAYGIFVHSVQKESMADNAGMRVGDQILEYNGTDLRRATAETAAFELAKPADKVTVLVQYNIHKFNQIKDKPGDHFYIRVGFDRNTDSGDHLSFLKDETLFVDNTMFQGIAGIWRAWKLDDYGYRLKCGIIPSQMKVEGQLRLSGDSPDCDQTGRRGSTSARRSFFKRIKPQRSSSRDSKELASFSNTHLSLFLDPNSINEEIGVPSYQRVERLEYKNRPVLVLGPLAEYVVDKLTIDFPKQFQRCMPIQMRCSKEVMEQGLQNNTIIDYRQRGSVFEWTTIQSIKEIKQSHCILDICISAVERLQRNQVYPIVLLIKFKSAKQIKEIKDPRYSTDKISAKAAKEMFEHALKLESDYRQYISVVIPAGVNITHMSTQIKAAVDAEQKKILWVPTS